MTIVRMRKSWAWRAMPAVCLLLSWPGAGAATFRFVKSQSGPSGVAVENRFHFDEVRNRFVYPQDTFLTVYFEWAGTATFRFVKSQSGPAGVAVENRFQFDEVRNRFVYPQDKFLTVYFEWEGPPGNHVLTAYWKDTQGAVASISPNVKIETKTSQRHAYWIFEVAPSFKSGIWTAEIRIDGEPSGTHNFELVLPTAPPQLETAAPPPPKIPTLDEMYASVGRSLVW